MAWNQQSHMAPKSQHVRNGVDKTHSPVNSHCLRRQHPLLPRWDAASTGYFSLFFWLRGRGLDAAPPCQRLTPQLSFMHHKLPNCRWHRLVPLHQEETISFRNFRTERQECTNHQKGEIDSNSCSLQQAAQHAGLVYRFFRCISDPTVSLVGSRKVFTGLIENDLLAYVWDVLVLDLKGCPSYHCQNQQSSIELSWTLQTCRPKSKFYTFFCLVFMMYHVKGKTIEALSAEPSIYITNSRFFWRKEKTLKTTYLSEDRDVKEHPHPQREQSALGKAGETCGGPTNNQEPVTIGSFIHQTEGWMTQSSLSRQKGHGRKEIIFMEHVLRHDYPGSHGNGGGSPNCLFTIVSLHSIASSMGWN